MLRHFFSHLMDASEQKSVSTDVFWGFSYTNHAQMGGLQIEALDDHSKAKITFTDKITQQKSFGKIEVFSINTLKKSPAYISAIDIAPLENLISVWTMRRNGNTIFVSAGAKQQAFAFTSEDVVNDFKKLFYLNLSNVDYFNEFKFCAYLKSQFNISIEQLRTIPGMDISRIQLLNQNRAVLEKLTSSGITLEEIGQLENQKLKKVIDNSYELSEALTFVTMRQILALDNEPLEISSIERPLSSYGTFIGSSGGGRFNDYIHESQESNNGKTVKITHDKKPGMFEAISMKADDNIAGKFNNIIKKMTLLAMVHNWFLIKDLNGAIMYCPELNIITHETHQLDIPEDYLNIEVSSLDFYKEKNFIEFLKEKNCPIEKFRSIPGISKEKILLLFKHQYEMKQLITKGLKLEDFAKIDNLRLENLLVNYKKIDSALKFVSFAQIVNLTSTPLLNDKQPQAIDEEKTSSLKRKR